MKRFAISASLVLLAALLFYSHRGSSLADPAATPGILPERSTATPLPTAPLTPLATSPFNFPASAPTIAPTPARDCMNVFPIETVERIEFGVTTLTQLEAAFGSATYMSGRARRFRFEYDGCVLIVGVGFDEALDAELLDYGTLSWLLERYGDPAAAGIAQGNLTLLLVGNTVLLYPDDGIIAVFDAPPDELTDDTPISSLQFRPPFEADAQLTRLNARPVEFGNTASE